MSRAKYVTCKYCGKRIDYTDTVGVKRLYCSPECKNIGKGIAWKITFEKQRRSKQ